MEITYEIAIAELSLHLFTVTNSLNVNGIGYFFKFWLNILVNTVVPATTVSDDVYSYLIVMLTEEDFT